MYKVILLMYLLLPIEGNQNKAVYHHDVEEGYIYIDELGNNVFIDDTILNDIGATKEQTLLLTMNKRYDWEIVNIEVFDE